LSSPLKIENYYHTDLKDIQINVTGDNATLKCTAYLQAKVFGMGGTFPFPVETCLEKKNGTWFYVGDKNKEK
jgi:hypothetical protein